MLHRFLLNPLHFEIMKLSESMVENLLIEVDSLTSRIRGIKQSYKATSNKGLKERLIDENKNIFLRIKEINELSNLLMTRSKEKITFSALLEETSRRTLDELKKENSLFFL